MYTMHSSTSEAESPGLGTQQGSAASSRPGAQQGGYSNNLARKSLEDATYEELASALNVRLDLDRRHTSRQFDELAIAEQRLEAKKKSMEELEARVLAVSDAEDLVELNVGVKAMTTTRAVLCSAEGSLLAGMFSGNFDQGLKRDTEGRIFLDIDPTIFSKVLSHLRLRRLSSPDSPAPLPLIQEDMRQEFDMIIRYLGLEQFMYGNGFTGNIFERISELSGVSQLRLQTHELVQLTLSSTGGVPATSHEEVLGPLGFHERALENSYGASKNSITIKFRRHRVSVEALELRSKVADTPAHMSAQWTFYHGAHAIEMEFPFARNNVSTGRLEVGFGLGFTDEVRCLFPKDFCLEHIVLHGRVVPM